MRMQKRKFRIGQLAKQLGVERFVVRFWEKEFGLRTTRSQGGQRFYDEDDLRMFEAIKTLLYKRGFTIAGAKKQLALNTELPTTVMASQRTTMEQEKTEEQDNSKEYEDVLKQMNALKQKLSKLREIL